MGSVQEPPLLPSVDSISGFAHAAGFAAAGRCLWFLVLILPAASDNNDIRLRGLHEVMSYFPFRTVFKVRVPFRHNKAWLLGV